METRALGTSLWKVVSRALERSGSVAGLVPSRSPFHVRHARAAASWALTERQGCGACSG